MGPYSLSIALLIIGARWDGKDFTAESIFKSVFKLVIRLETVSDKHWYKFACAIAHLHIGPRTSTENRTLLSGFSFLCTTF